MINLEQDILCVLLQTLKDDHLISQDVYDKARCNILDTLVWAEFFCYPDTDRKEEEDGHTQTSD